MQQDFFVFPTPVQEEVLYTQMGFFCSDSFDRSKYIHPGDLRVASLKSPSSIEYGNKKIF